MWGLWEQDHGAVVRSEDAAIGETLDWQQGFITFDDETLLAAATILNNRSREKLAVRDPRVAALRVTGRFQSGDAARFGRAVSAIHPVKLVRRGSGQLELVLAEQPAAKR